MGICSDCGQEKDELRDGVCFRCRMLSVNMGSLVMLKNERESGYTQREIKQEIFDAAKADGRDIQKVGETWT